jgi:hypothetical protein
MIDSIKVDAVVASTHLRSIKTGIWLYFILLIFEGAIRKWIFPGLSTPLLIIRDPIALWIILQVWYWKLLDFNIYLASMVAIGIITTFTALFLGHGNLFVALYGARIFILHFPLIFIIGKIFTREDVVKMGRAMLFISVPTIILVVLQFYSPQSAWVNRGVGGDTLGAGFSGALGFFRPPGFFSFTAGNTLFYSALGLFVFYFWLSNEKVNKILLILGTISLIAAIPLSLSRGLLFQLVISLIFVIIGLKFNVKYYKNLAITFVCVVILFFVVSQTAIFKTATDAFSARIETASSDEGGLKGTLIDRYVGLMAESIKIAMDQPLFGYGLGMGTNVGSILLSGHAGFLIAEEEWARIIGEIGPIFGILVILLRISLTIKIGIRSYLQLANETLLPWILFSLTFILLLNGSWAQPSALGFCVLISGLNIAALKT